MQFLTLADFRKTASNPNLNVPDFLSLSTFLFIYLFVYFPSHKLHQGAINQNEWYNYGA